MESSGVKFGTSGARGLVEKMTDEVCYCYNTAFLNQQRLKPGAQFETVAVGYDLRASSPRIAGAGFAAAEDLGLNVINFGPIPSPALALYGIKHNIPTIMVTGSHIPEDRNGIKYTTAAGEITKGDELELKQQTVRTPAGVFEADGSFVGGRIDPEISQAAIELYKKRFLDVFPQDLLEGKTIGVYQHSAVGRDVMVEILRDLGAEVVQLGRSSQFIPVDTEAIRPEDKELAARWGSEHGLDAIISTDGDSDRPLIADENGKWLRGDVAGILTAQFLGADAVALPVSCNTALERSGEFAKTYRTKIGSPYVIAGMEEALAEGYERVVSYEANGGFLQASPVDIFGKTLAPLPTRDAMIVHLSILALSIEKGAPLSKLLTDLPQRFTASDRLQEFPVERSKQILEQLSASVSDGDFSQIEEVFDQRFGAIREISLTDGLRITFSNSDLVIHFRPSGNAPEFRCYVEADSEEIAEAILLETLDTMRDWRK
jgi:phosphomannomutase